MENPPRIQRRLRLKTGCNDYLRFMAFEVKGTLKKLFDSKISQADFTSDFVVTTMEQYPQDIKFSALKEKSSSSVSTQRETW